MTIWSSKNSRACVFVGSTWETRTLSHWLRTFRSSLHLRTVRISLPIISLSLSALGWPRAGVHMANKVKMAEWSYPRYDGSSIVLAPVRYVRHLGSPTNYDNQPVAMTTAPNIVIRPYVSKWVLLDECWFLVGTWTMENVVCPWWIMCWLDTTLTMFYYILVHICFMLLKHYLLRVKSLAFWVLAICFYVCNGVMQSS